MQLEIGCDHFKRAICETNLYNKPTGITVNAYEESKPLASDAASFFFFFLSYNSVVRLAFYLGWEAQHAGNETCPDINVHFIHVMAKMESLRLLTVYLCFTTKRLWITILASSTAFLWNHCLSIILWRKIKIIIIKTVFSSSPELGSSLAVQSSVSFTVLEIFKSGFVLIIVSL